MKDKVKFVKDIKKFGENKLGLNFAGSFSRMAKGSFSCNWVYACYRDKIESVFGIDRPFEFYPEMDKALDRQKELDKWEKSELKKKINNAFIIRYRDYTVHYPLAKKIYQKSGSVKSAMEVYSKLFVKVKTYKQAEKAIENLNKEYSK
ncbi:TPA: hypothetical protein DCR49_09905 [Candidatus Delongbacteria bacterium]|nr:hypothetical protein [Candidatus Delongbacteria bacterium]